MDVGLLIPQGWKGEYDGWDAAEAWTRTTELVRQAEDLGFESVWVFDHFHTVPEPTDEITFESFSTLAAFAALTSRVRMGHMVVCAGYRNPALVAKLTSTLDVISGGRFELGIGAGWKRDEWEAYGYGFPPIGERLDLFGEALEVITRMLAPGRATYRGELVHVDGAINVPKGIQPHIPIIVGGNGPQRTAGLAIRFGDELNFVMIDPDEVARRIRDVRDRCEREDRDPATLRFSIYAKDDEMRNVGRRRIDHLAAMAESGLDRLVAFPTRWSPTAEAQTAFADDCRAAGLELGAPVGAAR